MYKSGKLTKQDVLDLVRARQELAQSQFKLRRDTK